MFCCVIFALGSSPLARGTRGCGFLSSTPRRLIPARAGNTNLGNLLGLPVAAHPRSRGEHLCPNFPPRFRPGSSPLARGTPVNSPAFYAVKRLIPARAGNTHRYPAPSDSCPAHPRSRGEHGILRLRRLLVCGSSPLARGTRRFLCPATSYGRLIPARAGNTFSSRSSFSRVSAHPRSRGEHVLDFTAKVFGLGSSPLARGTLRGLPRRRAFRRLIPARAGNTFLAGCFRLCD